MNTERREAFAAIEAEREYQDSKWQPVEGVKPHTCLEWFTYIEDYIAEAKHALSRQPDSKAGELALHTMRKVGAMAVAAMEQNGVRTRYQEGPRPIGFSAS